MTNTVKTTWKSNMQFESTNPSGLNLMIDAGAEDGGEGKGYRPKALMLSALAGCSGLDVVSLLKKMRAEVDEFTMDVEANLTDEHPKYYDKVKVTYNFYGSGFKKDKIEKAVSLSVEKYCGVMEMFRQFAEVTTEIKYFEK
ncbi:OsmC family protein [Aureibaculum sp. 2210JD6-5]|uniref:OsmC family protein n=1 Tax=Aureibaculum sp. 2210JD6-5 TaxID=3103957 RepID=UPI002AADF698|nr:OsmC family protein [Aureibaculum sp. 2210JD6-5]MDY7395648.1 OsmC family protein [Aureibaculum sp. 2210JD6-5]